MSARIYISILRADGNNLGNEKKEIILSPRKFIKSNINFRNVTFANLAQQPEPTAALYGTALWRGSKHVFICVVLNKAISEPHAISGLKNERIARKLSARQLKWVPRGFIYDLSKALNLITPVDLSNRLQFYCPQECREDLFSNNGDGILEGYSIRNRECNSVLITST